MLNQKPTTPFLDENATRQAVRSTLHAATRPSSTRLRQLMPPIPQQKRGTVWMRQLAPIAVLLLMMFGGLGIRRANNTAVWNAPPSHLASTATMTITTSPTATEALATEAPLPKATPLAMPPIQPAALNVAPAPSPSTPIAMGNFEIAIHN